MAKKHEGLVHGNDPKVRNSPKTIEDAEEIVGKQHEMNIVDEAAWDEYERLCKHPILNEKKFYTTSEGTQINLGKMPHHIQADIARLKLPPAEGKKIMTLKTVFAQIQNKKSGMFRKAYGANVKKGENGEVLSITNKQQSTLDLKRPELIELFGRMFSLNEVHELVLKIWKLPVSKQTLADWRLANVDAINNRMEQHKREYSDIRLVHKRSRLEELVWLYNKRKTIYQTTSKGDDHRLLMATLDAIKKEVEQDSIRIDHNLQINGGEIAEGMADTFSFITIKEMVVGRIAAKMGKNPMLIMQSMARGYYYQNIHAEEKPEEMPAFPSSQTYDFERIGKIVDQQKTRDEAEDAQVVSITTEQKSKSASIKELLLAKLREKNEKINYTKNSLNPQFIDKSNK